MLPLYENIKKRRIELGMSQEELAEKLGYKSRSTIAKIEAGINDITQSKIIAFAAALHTTTEYLMGNKESCDEDLSQYGIEHIKTKKFRMLGEIACGEPIQCNEEYESYVEASDDINADFCLTVNGDSMINARIYNGDIVFIREQTMVDNGEIAAVIIDNEATLKRVYYYREENKLVLSAENPKYAPLVYVDDELDDIRILGKAVAFMSYVK